LNDEKRDDMAKKFSLIEFNDGDQIIEEGEYGKDFFIIMNGINNKEIFIYFFYINFVF